jgi:hypothetical protein
MKSYTIVDVEFEKIQNHRVSQSGSIAFLIDYEQIAVKHLLLCSCSFLEHWFLEIVKDRIKDAIKDDYLINNLLYNSGIKRSFYSFFNFPDKQVHIFKKFDHENWKSILFEQCVFKESYDLFKNGFCEIFILRNELVHNNYASQSIPYTIDEIMLKFSHARCFMFALDKFIKEIQK